MSELCLSSTAPNTPQFSTLLLSDFLLLFSFILSHPLYFSYFIFFSPYLLKLLSFLSPLCLTTLLLLLGFLTVSPGLLHDESPLELPESGAGFLFSTYHAVTGRLRSSKTENDEAEFHPFEEVIEAYKIVFDSSILIFYENAELKVEENSAFSGDEWRGLSSSESAFDELEEKTVEIDWEETTQCVEEEKRLEGLLKELDEFESTVYNAEEKIVDPPGINSDEAIRVKKEVSPAESKAAGDQTRDVAANSRRFRANLETSDNGGDQYNSKDNPSSRTLESNLWSYGSMRKEKEWKRTLACKLFEERQNVNGGEAMDLLWETYEMDSSNKGKPKRCAKKKNKKKGESEDEYKRGGNWEEEDEEEDADMDVQLCCLQALKFSAGKMNLGRPNLVKISKAIKGIGWLHRVSRHGKKGYN